MKFGEALEALDSGKKIARSGWNGKDQFVFVAHIQDFGTDDKIMNDDLRSARRLPCYAIKTTQNTIQFGWLATQSDMQADDWQIVE